MRRIFFATIVVAVTNLAAAQMVSAQDDCSAALSQLDTAVQDNAISDFILRNEKCADVLAETLAEELTAERLVAIVEVLASTDNGSSAVLGSFVQAVIKEKPEAVQNVVRAVAQKGSAEGIIAVLEVVRDSDLPQDTKASIDSTAEAELKTRTDISADDVNTAISVIAGSPS